MRSARERAGECHPAAGLESGWCKASFRGFADSMQIIEFADSLAGLIAVASLKRVALMAKRSSAGPAARSTH
ncbi:MAG TPA: hypothetical protein VFJ45_12020 [bacterium]|nr:hypothetical protein [bacterium]